MFGHKRIPSREGGVEVVVTELASRMAAMGHEVTCYNRSCSPKSRDKEDWSQLSGGSNVRIKHAWTINGRGLSAMTSSFSAAFCTLFGKYDIVHIHAEGPAAMCRIPKLFGKRVVITIHGLDWARAKWGGFASKYIKWGEKQAAKHADEIIVLSKDVQEYFKREYNRNTEYIPNGVNCPNYADPDIIKNNWGLEKDGYALFVGRIVPEKGLSYLIEAWKELKTDKKLVIAGGSSDTQDYVNELMKNAGNNVIFTGFQQGRILDELFSNCYIYCLPSDLEGMPLSLLEAMSYGNCCVVSDISECTEVTEDYAVVFRKSDIIDLKEKLQMLLSNPARVNKYRRDVSDFVCRKYNWDDVVNQTMRLYRNEK